MAVVGWKTADLTADLASRMAADKWLVAREATVVEPEYADAAGDYRQTGRGARADLLCMRRQLSDSPMLICEVKVSRSDLLADLRAEKWRSYLKVAALVFAFPVGIAEPLEVPPEAGLIVRYSTVWRWVRQPEFQLAPKASPYLFRRMALTAADQCWIAGRDHERRRALSASAGQVAG